MPEGVGGDIFLSFFTFVVNHILCPYITFGDRESSEVKYILFFIRWNSVQSSKSAKQATKIGCHLWHVALHFSFVFSEHINTFGKELGYKNCLGSCKQN